MNEASRRRHELVEALLDPKMLHTRSALEDVARALLVLLDESVVQAQRIEMLETSMREHTHGYLRPGGLSLDFPREATTTRATPNFPDPDLDPAS